MIGYYQKDIGIKNIFDVFFVPFNFIIYSKKGSEKIIYNPSILEDLTLNLIKYKEDFKEGVDEGIVKMIAVNNDFLKNFRDLVNKKQDEKACYKILGLFEFVRTIKSDGEGESDDYLKFLLDF